MHPRLATVTLGGLAVLALSPGAAHAQLDSDTVVTIMRECRKIDDTAARAACYDNIPLGDVATAAPSAPAATAPARQGFGAGQLPAPRQSRAAAEPNEITATVASAVEREPGIYLITLDDGSQWRFVESAPPAYNAPGRGSTVEIGKASLGSYLLRHAGQGAIRARRVR